MNYAQYLRQGGETQSQEQLKLMQIVDAFKQNPQETLAQIPEEQRPQFLERLSLLAQELQDQELDGLVKQAAQEIGLLKCGGKVRAKIKKASCGKKMEKGGEAPIKKEAKDGKPCPCTLHKVGGRLIEVDCNGIPVAKNGDVLKFQQGGVNERYWHNKRYTSDEIKKIQAALNKQAIGKQIAVDGIIGPETIAAIKQFQQQHSDTLKVDGLVGDQTASALGITGLGDSSLTPTRKGQYQGRVLSKGVSGVSASENQRASQYYNSPEMLRYLMNATNANTDPLYYNHYQNALNYVSPEIASKLRALNNEGDAYDEMASKNRGQAFNRQVGIKEFKNAMASGVLKTADDLDRWMASHNLSKEEMNELMADPSVGDAMLVAGVRADNGRVNSQLSQAKNFAKGVASAESKAGVGVINSLTPISEAVYGTIKDVQDKGAGELRPDRWLYNRLNNTILSGYTGSHPTYLTDIAGSTGNRGVDYVIDIATAPESWMRFGASKNLNTNKVKPTYWRNTVKAGDIKTPAKSYTNGYIELGVTPRQPELSFYNVEKPEVRYKVGHNVGDLKTPGKLKFNYINEFNGYQIPAVHGVLINNSQPSPVIQEVPSYDKGITYGPYNGINRIQLKQGGSLNYAQYLNLK